MDLTPISLTPISQVLSLTLFEKLPIKQALMDSDYTSEQADIGNQLNLFDNLTGH